MTAKRLSSTSEKPKVTSPASGKTKILVMNKKVSSSPVASRSRKNLPTISAQGQNGPPPDPPDLQARIADRAHEFYTHRGGHHGQDLEDWLEAERQVLEEGCC